MLAKAGEKKDKDKKKHRKEPDVELPPGTQVWLCP